MQTKNPQKARLPLILALSLAGCSEVLGFGDDYKGPVGSECLPGTTKECVCAPGATVPCYDGLPETLGISACAAGTRTCAGSGQAFGACEGQVLCAGQYRWAKIYGDANGQTPNGVAVDGQGNVIVVGRVMGTVAFDGVVTSPKGPDEMDHDMFVLKLDPEGNRIWVRRWGDNTSTQIANAVAVDPAGNIVVVGELGGTVDFEDQMPPVPPVDPASPPATTDAFVIKLDPNGNPLWKARAGDASNQIAVAVAVDGKGDIVVTGYFTGKMSFDPMNPMAEVTSKGSSDMFVVKLESTGNHLWSRSFGDMTLNNKSFDAGYGIATDADQNVFVAGVIEGNVDFGNVPTKPSDMNSTGMDPDVVVLKLDASGGVGWARRFGDKDDQRLYGIAVDPHDKSVVITGEFASNLDLDGFPLTSAGATDAFLARLDNNNGMVTFGKQFGDMAAQGGTAVAIDSYGNMVLVSDMAGTVNFGGKDLTATGNSDIAVVKLDSTGNHIWSEHFGGTSGNVSTGIAVDAQGNILLTGASFGTVDFGGGLLSSAGMGDIVVAKLSP